MVPQKPKKWPVFREQSEQTEVPSTVRRDSQLV